MELGKLWDLPKEASEVEKTICGHENFKQVAKVSKIEVVVGLPKFGKVEKTICGTCQMGKQTEVNHQKVNVISTSHFLELLHVDLMGPTRTENLGGKQYIMVIVDDLSRTHRWNFLERNQKHVRRWRLFVRSFKTRKVYQ